MLKCFVKKPVKKPVFAINIVNSSDFKTYLKSQPKSLRDWMNASGFKAEKGQYVALPPDKKGNVVFIGAVEDVTDITDWACLITKLPSGCYRLKEKDACDEAIMAWGLSCYRFDRFRSQKSSFEKQLLLPELIDSDKARHIVESICFGRDLINLPANILTPQTLCEKAKALSDEFSAHYSVIEAENLLQKNYPLIYHVGQASHHAPCLIDIRWGDKKHPLVTLVGKGVCFDTGGLDLKPSRAMEIMQKDMGGSAHVLALAKLIMSESLNLRLRILIPAVENSVSGCAMRPGDIYQSRKGLSVEIGNTDAEGRLVLADALYEASSEKPDLLIDFATLTGAARVATGPVLPNLFSNDMALARELSDLSLDLKDPLWPMPLWQGYRSLLKGRFADLTNAPSYPYAGSILAALFLNEFIDDSIPWIHIDVMAWNLNAKPGFPKGGEIQGVRALFDFIHKKFL